MQLSLVAERIGSGVYFNTLVTVEGRVRGNALQRTRLSLPVLLACNLPCQLPGVVLSCLLCQQAPLLFLSCIPTLPAPLPLPPSPSLPRPFLANSVSSMAC